MSFIFFPVSFNSLIETHVCKHPCTVVVNVGIANPNTLISINATTQLPLKFPLNNQLSWHAQFHSLLLGDDFLGYIEGIFLCPPSTITNKDTLVSNPACSLWIWQDSLLLHAIFASLSDVIPVTSAATTSHRAWTKLATWYDNRVNEIKRKLNAL